MGMRIGSTDNTGASQGAGAAAWQQRQQGFKDLMASLQAGDLGAAQQAFSKLPGASSSTSGANSTSPLAQIGLALQAGDLAGAQQAAQALQAARGGHHHHGGHGGGAPTSTPAPAPAPAGTGSVLNLTA